ncbi:Peptidyl-prolyl cis-trans isomerase FKBP16-4, chloroplastic [Morella rubra]|uniref:peptidylprolyl isomerase n=1 Tax=Morella rubra TaxID=262757 RepID=A0A6A1WA72_9ROSI|nr:Peptidyl-prolyl cis-trans isomerase FKBP16-4, chloroplastic [Morella rubra]
MRMQTNRTNTLIKFSNARARHFRILIIGEAKRQSFPPVDEIDDVILSPTKTRPFDFVCVSFFCKLAGFVSLSSNGLSKTSYDINGNLSLSLSSPHFGSSPRGSLCDVVADAVSTSRRALRGAKVPESEFTTLPNGLKYYDLKVGGGPEAVKGSRVAVHYVAKWKGITFMTSRQGLGVGGGTPYGFDVGQSERGTVLKGLDLGVQGMRVGGQRLLLVPPELAYGSKGVQEIPPNATIELDLELLAIKQSPFGSPVKIVEG